MSKAAQFAASLANATSRLGLKRLGSTSGHYVRPHSFGALCLNSIRLYIENWFLLTGIYLLPAVLFTACTHWMIAHEGREFSMLWSLLDFKLTILLLGPLTVGISEACLGSQLNVWRAYRRTGPVFGRLVFAMLAQLLLMGSGAIFFAILARQGFFPALPSAFKIIAGVLVIATPLLVFGARYMFVQQAIILDHCRFSQSFERSAALGQGYYIRNLLYFLAISACLILVAVLAGTAFKEVHPPGIIHGWVLEVWSLVIGSVPAIIVTPIVGVALVLIYYDLRVRKEGFDLEQLEQELNG